jgi:effector-binding domain-containing protein
MTTQTYEVETRTLEEEQTAVVFATVTPDAISACLGHAFEATARYLAKWGAGPVGMPFARYHRLDDGRIEVEAGFAAITPVAGEADVEPSDLPAGPAAVTMHVGPYDAIGSAYDALGSWIEAHGGVATGDPYERYLTDPNENPDPTTWRTEVVAPYRPAS